MHNQPLAVCWTELEIDGQTYNITAREGATPDHVLAVVRPMVVAVNRIKDSYAASQPEPTDVVVVGPTEPEPEPEPTEPIQEYSTEMSLLIDMEQVNHE